jgi:hypothetical protein
MGRWATISRALWRGLLRSLAGHTSTQSVQPVQSSGATCRLYFCPLYSFDLKSTALNAAGAPASADGA